MSKKKKESEYRTPLSLVLICIMWYAVGAVAVVLIDAFDFLGMFGAILYGSFAYIVTHNLAKVSNWIN